MKKKDIVWTENGWISLQDADENKHTLGIACLAENGNVVELRMRHNDGEEQKYTSTLDATHKLPMALADFKKAYLADEIHLK